MSDDSRKTSKALYGLDWHNDWIRETALYIVRG